MIKTRIFKFVGHIHNMQLCIEMISFINHENESILRWFSGLFSRILCPVAGCIQTGWGSDLCLPAVVLWNSAPHVSTMLRSNLDLSDSVLDMLQQLGALAQSFSGALHVAFLKRFGQFFWRKKKERNNVLFVTNTIIQSITSSEMCSLYLTHPSAHTPGHHDCPPFFWI